MDMNLTLLRLSSSLAAHSTSRQRVLSENIAHADTPGYQARDIPDFGETLRGTTPAFSAKTTRPGHVAFGADPNGLAPQVAVVDGAESPNGNSVSLEEQMMRAAEVRQSHDMALGVYRKSMDILRSSLGRGR